MASKDTIVPSIEISCSQIGIPGKNVCTATFPDLGSMGMTLVRPQEFYESESERFRGHYFTLPSYAAWWARVHGDGRFDYPQRWGGYNLPGSTIHRWEKTFRDREGSLRDEEEVLIRKLKDASGSIDKKDMYLIGITREDFSKKTDVFYHELSHALYHLDPGYRRSASTALAGLTPIDRTSRERVLESEGYDKSVLDDEIVAQEAVKRGSALRKDLERVASMI